jgi:hypothetical protein
VQPLRSRGRHRKPEPHRPQHIRLAHRLRRGLRAASSDDVELSDATTARTYRASHLAIDNRPQGVSSRYFLSGSRCVGGPASLARLADRKRRTSDRGNVLVLR